MDEYDALARLCTGRAETDVETVLKAIRVEYRIRKRDNESYLGTADLHMDRLNLRIENGIVVEVSRG